VTSTASAHPPLAPPKPPEIAWWKLAILPLLLVAVRVALAGMMELSGDEAYYWTWSRNLAGGYFDHPPMVAWLIRVSVGIFRTNELGVRMPAILLGAGSMLVAGDIARICGATSQTVLRLQVALFCLPILQLHSALMTPDAPAMFFTLAAISWGLRYLIEPSSPRHWLMLGSACGLAMLSKYTALLPVATILLFVLIARPRYALQTIAAGALAVLVLWPMLIWNYQHDWVSFRFQLSHGIGTDDKSSWMTLGDYAGGQILVATPVLAGLMLWAAARTIRRGKDVRTRLLGVVGAATLLFFAFTSLRHKVEVNWPSMAWPILLILLELHVQRLGGWSLRALRTGVIVAAVAMVVLSMPPAFLLRLHPGGALGAVGGWEPLASKIDSMAKGLPIYATRYQDAGLLAFYLPGRPYVRVLRRSADRMSQFDLPRCPRMPDGQFVIVDNGNLPLGRSVLQIGDHNYNLDITARKNCEVDMDGLRTRSRALRWANSREGNGG